MKKRIIVLLILMMVTVTGCSNDNESLIFQAAAESISDRKLMVQTINFEMFDKASVGVNDQTIIEDAGGDRLELSDIKVGTELEITVLPEVRESYPVQVTATRMRVLPEGEPVQRAEYHKITAEQAKAIIDGETGVIILDVRTAEEFAEGHIEGALNIPNEEIGNTDLSLLPDKTAKILVYCRSGRRSLDASQKLIEMGYTNVFDFGGINDWPFDTVK